MKHPWFLQLLKVATIATLLSSLGGVITSQTAFAASYCTGNTSGPYSICLATSGAGVAAVQPTLHCGAGEPVLQGCNGTNWEKIGFSNDNGIQQYVIRYGWTYTGTGDGQRYFTFNNYAYFQPVNTSQWAITYSDGNEYGNSCYGGGSCDYNAWQNYISDYKSPTAQFRDWVTTGRPAIQSNIALQSPGQGINNCQGSQQHTATSQFNASIGLNKIANGSIGYNSTNTLQWYRNGECGANVPDIYSIYMNLNYDGGQSCYGAFICASDTESGQSYFNVTAFSGPNGGTYGNNFYQGWNLTVNYWNFSGSSISNYNLYGNPGGPNDGIIYDDWSY